MNSNWLREFKPKIKEFKNTIYLLTRNKLTKIALFALIALVIVALFAPMVMPTTQELDANKDLSKKLLPPSLQNIFGTDEFGRDIFTRVILGTRISFFTALLAVAISMTIGVALGAIAGYFGGIIDEILMRITDIFLSFPAILLAMAVAAFLGPSLKNAIIAIAISWWPMHTRIVRGQTASVRERQFVKASQAIGASSISIIWKHIIPNCMAPIIVQASMDFGSVIITIASLSFLGLGAQAPTPEWGLMVSISRNYFLKAWWYSVFPGLAIFFTVLVFNLVGDGLREVLDPKTRRK
jgi:peptide/nickel transport system permease protein